MIPHEYIEELTRRTDIVELVGSYVQLKRKGRLYGGLCPFHSEKTPSFYVYPDTQSFYCFGCQAAGDAISFVKKINNISSGEAIKMLASRAGMPEPQEDDKTGRLRSRVLSMNKEAARFFHACLNSTVEEARQLTPLPVERQLPALPPRCRRPAARDGCWRAPAAPPRPDWCRAGHQSDTLPSRSDAGSAAPPHRRA